MHVEDKNIIFLENDTYEELLDVVIGVEIDWEERTLHIKCPELQMDMGMKVQDPELERFLNIALPKRLLREVTLQRQFLKPEHVNS